MREGRDSKLIYRDDGVFVGVDLGADFTSEHEWGIAGIRKRLGVGGEGKIGLDARIITRCPREPRDKYETAFRVDSSSDQMSLWLGYGEERIERHKSDREVVGAWDEKHFGIIGRKAAAFRIESLREAFLALDVALWVGGSKLFGNGGLTIVIASRLPETDVAAMRAADEDRIRLDEASAATGIEARLKAAGKRWFALSPRWISDDRKKTSRHPVMYWLNPMEQDVDNFGWFTVEDLAQWPDGKGPVPMSRGRRR